MIRNLLILFALIFSGAAHANVVGADTQNFNPTNDGLDFVTVHSSKVLTPGLLNMGFFMNYAVNSLPNYENVKTQSRTNFQDSLISSDLNFGAGLTKNWEVGVSFPYVWAQSVRSDVSTYRGEFASTGMTEFRVMTKLHLLGNAKGGLATIFTGNFNQIDHNPFLGSGAGPTYNFELAGDRRLGKFRWGLNAGYRLRNPGEQFPGVPIEPIGSQYIASTALSYLIGKWKTKVIGEIFASRPVSAPSTTSDRASSTAEALLGIKWDVTRAVAFHFGGGTEIVHGNSSPDWRVYTGINWVLGLAEKKPANIIVKIEEQQKVVHVDPIEPQEPMDLNDIDPFGDKPQMSESFVAREILFQFDSDQLSADAPAVLQKLVDYLHKPPEFRTLIIEGHTDYIGEHKYNMDLSKRRALRVKQTLVSMGLSETKIKAFGYGETRPVANNGNFQGRALNRRVEFHVQR
jgi:outer membrane protein OmpA-like peptidoglycan-associated protein